MKIIIINSQKNLDKQPRKFDEYTILEIRSKTKIHIKFQIENSNVVARGNSHVEARGNSYVEARENSHVVAWGDSSVVAWGNSYVEAWGDSSVVAWGNSNVEARGNSHVVAWENSNVEAWGNSHVVARGDSSVVAWGNSYVEALGNSHVEARGNSHVVAWGDSSVVAWENSIIRAFSNHIKLILNQFSVAIGIGIKIKAIKKSKTSTIINNPVVKHSKKSFLEIYKRNIQPDGRILLYKITEENDTDYYTGKIKYEGTVKCPDWDPDKNRQCGGGLHLSPTPTLAKSYNDGKIKKCLVNKNNFVVFPDDITKVRCKEIEVLEDK